MGDVEATVLIGLVMVVGLAGTVVPVMPGVGILWLAVIGYGLLVGFGIIGWVVVALATLLAIASLVTGVLVPKRMADRHDVSRWSQLGGLVGAVAGFFVIPAVGVIVGAVAGVFVVEYVTTRQVGSAWQGTVAVAKGFGLALLFDVFFASSIITLWGLWALTVVL